MNWLHPWGGVECVGWMLLWVCQYVQSRGKVVLFLLHKHAKKKIKSRSPM